MRYYSRAGSRPTVDRYGTPYTALGHRTPPPWKSQPPRAVANGVAWLVLAVLALAVLAFRVESDGDLVPGNSPLHHAMAATATTPGGDLADEDHGAPTWSTGSCLHEAHALVVCAPERGPGGGWLVDVGTDGSARYDDGWHLDAETRRMVPPTPGLHATLPDTPRLLSV